MTYDYDDANVFARILRGEIPCTRVHETEHSLAFRDIAPQAPKHVLVIPKGAYVSFDHFARAAGEVEIIDFVRTIGRVCELESLVPDAGGTGFRMIANAGHDGVQEVPHLHVHVLGGRVLGPMLKRD